MWVQPVYDCAADYVYRLKVGLMDAGDVPAEWHDLVVAVKTGIAEARADQAKRGGGGGAAKAAPVSEQKRIIEAARERMKARGKEG